MHSGERREVWGLRSDGRRQMSGGCGGESGRRGKRMGCDRVGEGRCRIIKTTAGQRTNELQAGEQWSGSGLPSGRSAGWLVGGGGAAERSGWHDWRSEKKEACEARRP